MCIKQKISGNGLERRNGGCRRGLVEMQQMVPCELMLSRVGGKHRTQEAGREFWVGETAWRTTSGRERQTGKDTKLMSPMVKTDFWGRNDVRRLAEVVWNLPVEDLVSQCMNFGFKSNISSPPIYPTLQLPLHT